jgi:hypothetical protein
VRRTMSPRIAIDMLRSGSEYDISGFRNLASFQQAIGPYFNLRVSSVALFYVNPPDNLRYKESRGNTQAHEASVHSSCSQQDEAI